MTDDRFHKDRPRLRSKASLALLVAALCASTATASNVAVADDGQYTVKTGDTLWSLSGNFFDNPEAWPELWRQNSAIKNPHRIYPGNVLALARPTAPTAPTAPMGGETMAARQEAHPSTSVNLSTEDLAAVALRASLSAQKKARRFFEDDLIVSEASLRDVPQVVSFASGRLLGMRGDVAILNRKAEPAHGASFYRLGPEIKDPLTGAHVGRQLRFVGPVETISSADGTVGKGATIGANRTEVGEGDVVALIGAFKPAQFSAPDMVVRKYDRAGRDRTPYLCQDGGTMPGRARSDGEVLLISSHGGDWAVGSTVSLPDQGAAVGVVVRMTIGLAYVAVNPGAPCVDAGARITSSAQVLE